MQQLLPFTVLKRMLGKAEYIERIEELQQLLPFTVLKPVPNIAILLNIIKLQQLLPFTVLKLNYASQL